ncbi:hypothetical protein HDU97_004316 [Phlyctochytrium planicorne]|nr:hypothetical protein HDU97_004316 [Phlyctochytrium planicorne]
MNPGGNPYQGSNYQNQQQQPYQQQPYPQQQQYPQNNYVPVAQPQPRPFNPQQTGYAASPSQSPNPQHYPSNQQPYSPGFRPGPPPQQNQQQAQLYPQNQQPYGVSTAQYAGHGYPQQPPPQQPYHRTPSPQAGYPAPAPPQHQFRPSSPQPSGPPQPNPNYFRATSPQPGPGQAPPNPAYYRTPSPQNYPSPIANAAPVAPARHASHPSHPNHPGQPGNVQPPHSTFFPSQSPNGSQVTLTDQIQPVQGQGKPQHHQQSGAHHPQHQQQYQQPQQPHHHYPPGGAPQQQQHQFASSSPSKADMYGAEHEQTGVKMFGTDARLGTKKGFWQKLIPHEEGDGERPVWARRTLFTMLGVSVIMFILQSIVINRQTVLFYQYRDYFDKDNSSDDEEKLYTNIKASLVYSSSFYLAIFFGVFVAWDSILQKNIVQILAMVAYNFGMFVFTIIQFSQISVIEEVQKFIVDVIATNPKEVEKRVEKDKSTLKGVEIGLVLVCLLWFLTSAFFAYRLYYELTWKIYRRIGGNIKMEKDYRNYHIYLLCIKYSIFFTTVFLSMIFVMVDGERIVLILTVVIGVPLAVAMLSCAYFGARKESRTLMIAAFISSILILVYTAARVYRMYDKTLDKPNGKPISDQYTRIRTPGTFFGVMAIILLIGAGVYTFVVTRTFEGGLKKLLAQNRKNAPPLAPLDLDE